MPKVNPVSAGGADAIEFEEVKSNWWKLQGADGKPLIGSFIQGVYVKREVRDNTLKDPVVKQAIYTLVQDDGTPIFIGGRGRGTPNAAEPQIIAGLEGCKIGDYVKLVFEKELPPKRAGNKPTKVIKAYKAKTPRPEVVAKFLGTEPDVEVSDVE